MTRMPQRRRRSREWERIRVILRKPRASYAAAEVPALLGIEPAVVQRAMEDGEIGDEGGIQGAGGRAQGAGVRSSSGAPPPAPCALSWEDVVSLGLEHRWTLRMLTEALQGRDRGALPPLVRTVAGRVVLPRHQWQILRFLAEDRARAEGREITVSDLVEQAVSTALLSLEHDWERIEAAYPGARAAAAWPSTE